MRDGRAALDALAGLAARPLRRRARARRRPPRRPRRRRATPAPGDRHAGGARGSARARAARAAPPAAQPGGDRGGRASSCPACRRWRASTRASIAASRRSPSWCRCRREIRARRRAALRLPRPLLRVHRLGAAGGGAGDRRRPRDRRAPGQRRQPLRDEAAARASTARSASPRSTGSAWARGPARSIPASSCISSRPRALREGGRDDALQEVGPARHLRHQQRHARSARRAASPAPGWRWTTSSTARPRRSARSPRCSAASTRSCSPPGIGENSAEIRRRICEASAWLGIELDAGRERRARARGSRTPGSAVSAWVIPTNEELMIARHTGALLGLAGAARLARGKRGADMATTAPSRHERRRRRRLATASGRASGRRRSTSATSSSRTTRRTTATSRSWRRRPRAPTQHLGQAQRAVRRGAQEGRARRLPDPELDHRARARLHRPGQRDHRRPADRRAAQARDHAERRLPHGRRARSKTYGYTPDPHVVEAFTKYRKTHNDGGLRRLHRRHPALPQLAHPHRACPTPTAAAASSATTGASRSTAWTG